MISKKRKIFVQKVVNTVMINLIKMQLRIKIKLIRVIVVTLMVPQTSTNVVKMASEEKKITR